MIWSQHFETVDPLENQEHVGSWVETMNKVDQLDNNLKLECGECHTEFWFKPEQGGINSVVRKGQFHAKCPSCRGEWDGTIPLPYFAFTLSDRNKKFSHVFDDKTMMVFAVQADNLTEALAKFTWPDTFPDSLKNVGLEVGPCSKEVYQNYIQAENFFKSSLDTNNEDVKLSLDRFVNRIKNIKTENAVKEVMDNLTVDND